MTHSASIKQFIEGSGRRGFENQAFCAKKNLTESFVLLANICDSLLNELVYLGSNECANAENSLGDLGVIGGGGGSDV